MTNKIKEVKEVELNAEQAKTNEFIEKINALMKEYNRNLNAVVQVGIIPEATPEAEKEVK